jgi:hypothetical protein
MSDRLRGESSGGVPSVSLDALLSVFYADSGELARFWRVDSKDAPADYQRLLAHASHMTVTVEDFYKDRLDVRVLRSHRDGLHYCREILLSTQLGKRVVQYGIVRLHLGMVPEGAKREILSECKPLGRVLIEHDVLRQVECIDLFRVEAGVGLARMFGCALGAITYGRTALIYCNGEPAIELIEIVAPV